MSAAVELIRQRDEVNIRGRGQRSGGGDVVAKNKT